VSDREFSASPVTKRAEKTKAFVKACFSSLVNLASGKALDPLPVNPTSNSRNCTNLEKLTIF
jgi:hypothetical protein